MSGGKDGEFRAWELARCIKEQFPQTNGPVRRNVEFFIGFRNKIEAYIRETRPRARVLRKPADRIGGTLKSRQRPKIASVRADEVPVR